MEGQIDTGQLERREQDLATRYVLETFHRLRTDEAVKYRREMLQAAINKLPVPTKMDVWKLAGWCTHTLWSNDAPMPQELKQLLGRNKNEPLSYSEFVFNDE